MSKGKRMSKRTRTLILSAVAVVALGGILAALLLIPPKAEGPDASSGESEVSSKVDLSVSLLDKTKDADGKLVESPVKEMSVKLADEEFKLVDKDGDLVVEAYKDLPVDSYGVGYLIDEVSSITAVQKLDNPEAADAYGFNAPQATVTVTYHDDSTYSFELGDVTPYKDGYYFREAGGEDVYIVATSMGDTVTNPSTDYIGRTLMTAPTVKSDDSNGSAVLRDMTLSGSVRSTSIAFQMVTTEDQNTAFAYSTYKITSPYLRGMESNTGASFASYTSLSASGVEKAFPTKEDLAKYGLDTPYSVAKLNLAVSTLVDDPNAETSGDSETVQKTSYYNVTPHTFTVGGKNADGYYYVMADDIPVVYLVSASSIELWVDVQYNDLADVLLFLQDITTVSTISVEQDGKETAFRLTHHPDAEDSEDRLTVKVGDTTYATEDFRVLYQVMMGIKRTGAADSKPSGTPELTLKVTLTGSDTPIVVATFYENTPSLSTCMLGTGEYFLVRSSDIRWLKAQFERYLNGEKVDNRV